MLGHSSVHFTDQYMVLDNVQEWITSAADGPVNILNVCLSPEPTHVGITANDDQQDATILVYLFIPNQLYMFWAMSLPLIGST